MNLEELLRQKDALEAQIEATRRQEKSQAIEKVKALLEQHGLTLADLDLKVPRGGKRGAAKGGKVAAKYRDKVTGQTWSGRGLKPTWLREALAAGRQIEEFAV